MQKINEWLKQLNERMKEIIGAFYAFEYEDILDKNKNKP